MQIVGQLATILWVQDPTEPYFEIHKDANHQEQVISFGTENGRAFVVNHNLASPRILKSSSDIRNYTAGNLGNSLIADAFLRQVGQRTIHGIPSIANFDFSSSHIDPAAIRDAYDFVVLIFQDHIRPDSRDHRFDYRVDFSGLLEMIRHVRLPGIVPSLGVNFHKQGLEEFISSLDAELVRFLRGLSELTPAIGVRGAMTADVLRRLGVKNTRIIGCPSYYSVGKELPATNTDSDQNEFARPRVAFTSDMLIWKSPRNRHHSQIPIVLQSEFDLIEFALEGRLGPGQRVHALRRKGRAGLLRAFPNPPAWRQFYKNFDFAIGARFHWAMAAHATGVPLLIVSDDQRTRELSEHLQLFRKSSISKKSVIDDLNRESVSYRRSNTLPA